MDWAERSQEVARVAVTFELVDPQKSGVHAAPFMESACLLRTTVESWSRHGALSDGDLAQQQQLGIVGGLLGSVIIAPGSNLPDLTSAQ